MNAAMPLDERSHAVHAAGLKRTFGRRRAVDGVNLELAAGDCLALFGPNGAGKTTLLRLIAGLLKPTSGTVTVGGRSLRDESGARGQIGLISHQSMLYGALTARENVEFAARLYGVADARIAATHALERMQIADRADAPVKSLSRGLQQRVSIARAIVHEPTVVLLDEPYTGLDAVGGAALTDMLNVLRSAGACLVLVTHNVDEGLAVASHAAVMIAGRIVRHDARAALDSTRYLAEYRALVMDGSPGASAEPVSVSA
ncbi:MAG TPA: heme ABC exporter ATP-binding protein CcmA [Gemmatimonadaceae bacterium]|nr:heme ABC exporter ATP-binding protein CcmA [Gemmatimonadaceae bacterium]